MIFQYKAPYGNHKCGFLFHDRLTWQQRKKRKCLTCIASIQNMMALIWLMSCARMNLWHLTLTTNETRRLLKWNWNGSGLSRTYKTFSVFILSNSRSYKTGTKQVNLFLKSIKSFFFFFFFPWFLVQSWVKFCNIDLYFFSSLFAIYVL